MKKEDKIVNMAYDDTIAFLLNNKKTDKWRGKNGSFISYGLLNAVFETLFSLAPSKEVAMELIHMSLCNFIDNGSDLPEEEYDPNSFAEMEANEGSAIEYYENNKNRRGK
tara:strand:+ start:481 stop:810 length:330 start_codon:yes stop_codon:yes gene_type:complete